MAVKINDVDYSWAMIELTSPALTGSSDANPEILSGVTAVKWNRKRNVKTNYGLGGKATGRGFGNVECSASITMDYGTQAQLRALKGSLGEIGEFDLIVTWATDIDSEIDTGITNNESVTLKGCFFNEDGLDTKQDDTQITKEFDLNPFDIDISHGS
jgi:hypothetical protein